jgi:16S rRNA (guanine966-N2)-methyltransferase
VIRRGRPSRVRIIGGAWRRRWLPVAPVPGLRPSADAQRETLFNWLQPAPAGGRPYWTCSRAPGRSGWRRPRAVHASVLLLEKNPVAARQLEANCRLLGAGQVTVRQDDALRLLAQGRDAAGLMPFNVVFVDPPFQKGLVAPVLEQLLGGGWLAPDARVYVEQESRLWRHRPAGRSCASGPGDRPAASCSRSPDGARMAESAAPTAVSPGGWS